MQPALDELEGIGFLEPGTRKERYQKDGQDWKIRLVRKTPPRALEDQEVVAAVPPPVLVTELIRRGVTGKTAADLVKRHPAEAIQTRIEVFDWLVGKRDKKVSKSPPGYLVKSIDDDYAPPKGFVSQAERDRQAEANRQAEHAAALDRRRKQDALEHEQRLAAQVKSYRRSLTPEQLAGLEADAIAGTDEQTRAQLANPTMRSFRQTRISRLVNDHIAGLIQAGQLVVD